MALDGAIGNAGHHQTSSGHTSFTTAFLDDNKKHSKNLASTKIGMGEGQWFFTEWGKACQMILLMILAMVTPTPLRWRMLEVFLFLSLRVWGISRIFNRNSFQIFPDFPKWCWPLQTRCQGTRLGHLGKPCPSTVKAPHVLRQSLDGLMNLP